MQKLTDLKVATNRRAEPATVALCVLILAVAFLLLYAGRHLTFFYDEWTFITTRRGSAISTYLDPHNGHLSLFPIVVYKVLFALFGLRHYTPYRAVGIALHLLCAGLLYVLARRRLGSSLALVPTVLLLCMGTAFQVLLWPFQIGYLASIAGGLGALVVIDREARQRDVLVAALLTWSVFSSGVGLTFLVACAIALIAGRSPWQRLWTIAVPAVLFAIWYLGWGSGEATSNRALATAPQYVADAFAGAVAGIVGLDQSWAPALGILFLAIVAVLWRSGRRGEPTPLLLAAVAGALTFWVLAAVTRAGTPEPAASRYLYVGAVFLLLIAAEASAGIRLHGVWAAGGAILLFGALTSNLGALRDGERSLRTTDDVVRASLGVVEIAAPIVSPAFQPDPVAAPQITAGPYLSAVRDLGSPALTATELEHSPATIRARSDLVLAHAEQLAIAPGPTAILGDRTVSVSALVGGRLTARGLCKELQPTAPNAIVDIAVATGRTLLVHAARGQQAALYLRRLSSDFGAPFAYMSGTPSAAIRFPADRAPTLHWQVRLLASAPVEVCVR